MDITVMKTHEEQQLIPMSLLPITRRSPEEQILIQSETNENENQIANEGSLVPRLFSRFKQRFNSPHLPHLSDQILRTIFLLFIVFIGITSFTTALIVGSSIVRFKQQCPLYASFQFQILVTSESNWTVKIIPLTERFSSQSTCDFCTFFNVFTFIYCIMTGFFFVLFNGDQRVVTTNDKCLIIPWFPISLILGLFSLINAAILTNGFLKFCNTIISNDKRIQSCAQLNDLYFEQYPKVSSFFIYMLISILASWIQLVIFIGIITILTIRLVSSFNGTDSHDVPTDERSDLVLQSTEQI